MEENDVRITQDEIDELMTTYSQQGSFPISTTKKLGRPKLKQTENFIDATITPVMNGYEVTSKNLGNEKYVFNVIEDAFKFIKEKLRPTGEQDRFLKAI